MPSSPVRPPVQLAQDDLHLKAFRRFVELYVEMKEINERKRRIQPELLALKPVLLAHMAQSGVPLLRVDGFTLSPKRVPWVYPQSGVSRQVVIETLKLCGLGRFVTESFSTRTLTAYVKELEEAHHILAGTDPEALSKLLPAPLSRVLDVRPGFDLQVLDRREGEKTYENADEQEGQDDEEL